MALFKKRRVESQRICPTSEYQPNRTKFGPCFDCWHSKNCIKHLFSYPQMAQFKKRRSSSRRICLKCLTSGFQSNRIVKKTMLYRFEHERYPSPGEKSKRTGPVKSIATRAQTSSSLLRSDEKNFHDLKKGK